MLGEQRKIWNYFLWFLFAVKYSNTEMNFCIGILEYNKTDK